MRTNKRHVKRRSVLGEMTAPVETNSFARAEDDGMPPAQDVFDLADESEVLTEPQQPIGETTTPSQEAPSPFTPEELAKDKNCREPNFRDPETGKFQLLKCFHCRPEGRGNLIHGTRIAVCNWCGARSK